MTAPSATEDLARAALGGDRDALERLVQTLQPDVYGLALRMLWNREDAEDATQEILVRVVTRLSQFDFRSRLTTWAYRVAVNYLLDTKKSAVERMRLSFMQFGDDLASGLSAEGPAEAERSLLVQEVQIGCTLGMLQCLDREHRAAYILGEILELPGAEAAAALEIGPALFRKRLQHARAAIESFTRAHCGLVADAAACRCTRRVPAALRSGRVRKDAVTFARDAASFAEVRAMIHGMDEARRTLALYRGWPPRESPVDVARTLLARLEQWPTR